MPRMGKSIASAELWHSPILADLSLRRYPHDFLLPRIWELRNNLTAYDAAYVALAEALDAPLLTRDKRLAAAAGHHAQIELA
jgi:predicted nucleic acid-binding protein